MPRMGVAGSLFAACMLVQSGHARAAQPIVYDCDTGFGKFSQIRPAVVQADYRVRGKITPIRVETGERFHPTASVSIVSADRTSLVGIQVVLAPTGKFNVIGTVIRTGAPSTTLTSEIGMATSVTFDFYAPSAGGGFADIAGTRIPLPFSIGPNATISISCSSGEFRFDALDWNWQKAP